MTSNEDLKRKVQVLRDHGQDRKYHHSMIGWNGRMDGIQGAVLGVKLQRLPEANFARRRNAAIYDKLLASVQQVVTPKVGKDRLSVYHVYAVRVQERDGVLKRLSECGIGCGVHYPVPVHLQPAYACLEHRIGDFPVSEACGREFLSLPMFPELTPIQIESVVQELREATE